MYTNVSSEFIISLRVRKLTNLTKREYIMKLYKKRLKEFKELYCKSNNSNDMHGLDMKDYYRLNSLHSFLIENHKDKFLKIWETFKK